MNTHDSLECFITSSSFLFDLMSDANSLYLSNFRLKVDEKIQQVKKTLIFVYLLYF